MVDNIDPVAAMQFNANNAADVLHRDRKVDIQKDKKYGHMVWRVPHVLGCGIGPAARSSLLSQIWNFVIRDKYIPTKQANRHCNFNGKSLDEIQTKQHTIRNLFSLRNFVES